MADTTVGSLLIKLLFQTNAGEVLGEISAQASASDEMVKKLINSSQGLTVAVNSENAELQKSASVMREKRSAVAGLAEVLGSAAQATEPLSQKLQRLSAILSSDNLTVKERIDAERELMSTIERVATSQDILNNAYRTELEIVSRSRAMRAEMRSMMSTATAAPETDAAIVSAEALTSQTQMLSAAQLELAATTEPASETIRRLTAALESEGLTINERIAAEKMLRETINSVASEQEILNQAYGREFDVLERSLRMRQDLNSVQPVKEPTPIPISIVRSKEDANNDLGPIREATVANEAHRKAIEQLELEKRNLGDVTVATGEIESNVARTTTNAYKEELGAVEQLLITKRDIIKARELIPSTEVEKIAALNAELNNVNRQLFALQGRGLKNLRNDFNDTAFQINRTHQVLFALSFLMNAMSSDKASEEQRKWQRSLTEGTTTAIGTSFALQAMGGEMAKIAGPVGIAVGALASIIAALNQTDEAAKKAAEQGVKAFTEQMKGLSTTAKIEIVTDLDKEIAAVRRAIGIINENAPKIVEVNQRTSQRTETPILTDEQKAQIAYLADRAKALQENKAALQAQLLVDKEITEQERVTNAIVDDHRTRLQQIDAQLKIRNQELASGIDLATQENLSDEQRTGRREEAIVLERQRAELLKTSAERMADSVALAEAGYKAGEVSLSSYRSTLQVAMQNADTEKDRLAFKERITALDADGLRILQSQYQARQLNATQYVAELQALLAITTKTEQRLAIEKQILEVKDARLSNLQAEANLGDITIEQYKNALEVELQQEQSEERRLKLRAQLQELNTREKTAERSLDNDLAASGVDLVENAQERAKLEEDIRHTKALQTIEDRTQAAIKAGVKPDDAYAAAWQMINDENDRHAKKLATQEADYAKELNTIRISLLEGEEAKVHAKYKQERADLDDMLKRGAIDRQKYDLETQSSRKREEIEIAAIRQSSLDEYAQAVDLIGNALSRAFKNGGDEGIQKMLAMLQIALQIAKVVEAMNAGTMSGPLGIISIFASVLGLGTLFSGGGSHGNQSAPRPQRRAGGGIVEPGSYVINEKMSEQYKPLLDALGADEVTGGIAHKDSVFADTGSGTVALTPKERILPPELATIGELMNKGHLTAEQMGQILLAISDGRAASSPITRESVLERIKGVSAGAPIVIDAAALTGGMRASKDWERVVAMNKNFGNITRFESGGAIGGSILSPAMTNIVRSYASVQRIAENSATSARVDLAPLLDEVRDLRSEMVRVGKAVESVRLEFPDKVTVDHDNMELRLRREIPKYERFRSNKKV